ncbi:MAG: chemotaxis protein CheX [Waterburya sp.]
MDYLTYEQLDALQEIVNIGIGRAAAMLNEMVDARIVLEVPTIQLLTASQLLQEMIARFNSQSISVVRLGFSGSLSGTAELMFPTDSASVLVAVLTGEDLDSPDLDAVKIGTLSEIGNIVINGVIGSISNILEQRMEYKIPSYCEDTIENLLLSERNMTDDVVFILAQARFAIEQLEIVGDIILIFEMKTFDNLLKAIDQQLIG